MALRLDTLEGDHEELAARVKVVESALSNRLRWSGFVGAAAGTMAVLIPLCALLFTVWHYSKP